MAEVFLSYASVDRPLADTFQAWLTEHGHRVFIDHEGIRVGDDWHDALVRQLREMDALVCLVTPDSIASRWCFAEIFAAGVLDKPRLPLCAEPAGVHPNLPEQHAFFAANREAALEAVHARLLAIVARGGTGWTRGRSVYPGLQAYDVDDAGVFFGRRREIDALVRRVCSPVERAESRFTGVVGASGSGKSSLVRAGMVPRIMARSDWMVPPPIRPGKEPLYALARALVAIGAADDLLDDPAVLVDGLHRQVDRLLARQGRRRCLLAVDQLEELFTESDPVSRQRFLATLQCALDHDTPLSVVATTRWEYVDRLRGEAPALHAFERPEVVSPLDTEMLMEVVTEPLRLRGIALDPPELARRMVADTGSGAALPLLAYTLQRLTDPFPQEGGTLTGAMYDAEGGVRGALTRQADAALAALERAPGRDAVLAALLRLVTVGEGDQPMRRALHAAGLPADVTTVLDAFVQRRLVVARDEPVVYEVAHEALFTAWRPLARAFAGAIDDLRSLSELERDAAAWDRSGRSTSDYLWVGERLDRAQRMLAERPGLSAVAGALVAASLQADRARRERSATQLAERSLEQIDTDPELSVLLCRAAARQFGPTTRLAYALQQALEASRIEGRVRALFLEAAAISGDGRSVLLGRPASDPPRPSVHARRGADVPRAIVRQDLSTRQIVWETHVEGDRLDALAISPDDSLIVCAVNEALYRLDGATGAVVGEPVTHPGQLRRIAWSRAGTFLVVSDARAALYDASGALRWSRDAAKDTPFFDGCVSPGGRTVALGDETGTRLWTEQGPVDGLAPSSWSVELFDDWTLVRADPQQQHVVYQPWQEVETAWAEHEVRDLRYVRVAAMTVMAIGADGLEVWPMWHPEDGFGVTRRTAGSDAALTPDGRHALLWNRHGATLWDVAPRGLPDRVIAVDGHPTWCGWLPDDRLATLTAEGSLFVELEQVAEPGGTVLGTSDDGRYVLLDLPLAILDVAAGRATPLDGPQGMVRGAGFSADGRTVAIACGTRIELWDTATGACLATLAEHEEEEGDTYRGVALSPDGTLLATASEAGGRSSLWRVAGGEPLHHIGARLVRFTADGAILVAALWDRLRVVRTSDGEVLGDGSVGGETRSLDLSGDGLLAVTAGSHEVTVWTLPDLGRRAEFPTSARPVRASFHADGTRVLAAYEDGSVRVWRVPSFEALLERADDAVFRDLTDEERRRFGLPAA